ncbi:MAG TPA: hypothetical protein VFT24_00635 [Vicinamibacterales bacterium]|nr:hypothetical protein [Vicinamibacterales bacterium]
MGWFDWWRSNGAAEAWTRHWKKDWAAAVEDPDAATAAALRARLEAAGLDDERFEIEREMLEGLEAVLELGNTVAARGPETIVTGHRAVGADRCYFSAPVSLPDDPGQPSGTLLLTNLRAIFIGGSRAATVPWHAVGRSFPQNRDLVLIRTDREDLHRFRCNSFADAMRAAFLARHLSKRRV